MATAKVTITLSPDEHRLLIRTLNLYERCLDASVRDVHFDESAGEFPMTRRRAGIERNAVLEISAKL